MPSVGKNSRILPIWSEVPGCTLQSATPALMNFRPEVHKVSLHEFTVPLQHFGTLHRWCVRFLSTIFYPFRGRKYRIGMFGRREAQTGKKTWRETFGTTGEKFWRKILPPSQNFRTLPIWSEVPGCTMQGAECHATPSELHICGA